MAFSFDSQTQQKSFVRWQPLQPLSIFCELHSTNADVLHRAQLLFAPCIDETTNTVTHLEPTENRCVWRWTVEREPENAVWRAGNSGTGAEFADSDVRRVLTFIEYSTVQALVDVVKRENTPLFAMHTALLCKENFGLIVVGPSQSGKSTLSCALWRSGWQLLCDDFCFLQNGNEAFPARRRVSLRAGSRELVGEELWTRLQNAPSSYSTDEGWIFHPHEIADSPLSSPLARCQAMRVNAIVFLGRDGMSDKGAEVSPLQRINAARAALALLPYCTLLPREDPASDSGANRVLDWSAALPKIAPLVERAPVYSLKRGALPQMIASVEALRLESARENL
jgi:hypothetical protein